jgi:hypothetical protein
MEGRTDGQFHHLAPAPGLGGLERRLYGLDMAGDDDLAGPIEVRGDHDLSRRLGRLGATGLELIGFVPRSRCTEKSDDVANDFQELQGSAEYLTLRPGCFAICFPEDGHQPGIGTGAHSGLIRKIVIKVPVGR